MAYVVSIAESILDIGVKFTLFCVSCVSFQNFLHCETKKVTLHGHRWSGKSVFLFHKKVIEIKML